MIELLYSLLATFILILGAVLSVILIGTIAAICCILSEKLIKKMFGD